MKRSHGLLALLPSIAFLITACSSSTGAKPRLSGASRPASGRSTLTVQISSAGGTIAGNVTVDGTTCAQRICHYSEQSRSHVTLVESTTSSHHPFVKWQVGGTARQEHSITLVMSRRYVYVNAIFRL